MLWNKLNLNITPKLHILIDHGVVFLTKYKGFGDLGEDACKREHQVNFQRNTCLAAVKQMNKKERCTSSTRGNELSS